MEKFSIIIVTWQNRVMLNRCIDLIRKHSDINHQIIVAHNEHKGEEKIKDAHNILFCKNVGLCKAANEASLYANTNYICLIDDDIEVLPKWDINLFNNDIYKNWIASTRIEPIAPHYNISCDDYKKGKIPEKFYHNISNTPLLIPRKFWEKIGGYDEDFVTIGAELGLAKKAYDAGERLFLQTPNSMVIHKQSQSTKRLLGIANIRKQRDKTFSIKYGMTRKKFIKIIKKGEVFNPWEYYE